MRVLGLALFVPLFVSTSTRNEDPSPVAPRAASHPSTVAFEIPERDLLPESIAHDPADGSFYVGSMHKRKIVQIAANRSMRDFVTSGADGLGMKVDPRRRDQNGTKIPRVVRATLAADGAAIERVEVLEEAHPRFDVPTTGVIVGDDLYYVATSQLDSVDPSTNTLAVDSLEPNVILKLPLAATAEAASAPTAAAQGVALPPPTGGCASRR